MKLGVWAAMLALLLSVLIWSSCGDVYRSPIIPVPSNPGDPQLYHFVMSLNQSTNPTSGSLNAGTVMQIDTSGDTSVGVATQGTLPVHATILPTLAFNRVYVANAVSDTVSTFTASPQSCTTTVCPIGTVTSITMPAGSHPSFVHSSEGGVMYVILPGANPPAIGVINANTNQLLQTIPIPGAVNPVAMTETFTSPRKLYVADSATNTVTVIDALARSVVTTITHASFSSPANVIAHPDGSAIFVMNAGSSSVSVVSTSSDSVIGTVSGAGTVNSIAFDSKLTRLYLTDVSGQVNIFNAAVTPGSLPALLRTVSVPNVVRVAALPNGTKVYALSAASGATIDLGLTPIDSQTLAAGAVVPVASVTPSLAACGAVRFRTMAVAGGDSARVYVSSCDGQATYILRTSDNTMLVPLPAPSTGQLDGAGNIVLQNPVFLVEGH